MMNEKQVIPEAAVEAAAKAMYAQDGGAGEFALWIYQDYARAMLEAAAPHIAAQALEEAAHTFEGLPMNSGASISSGTYDWFELFPIQHMRDRAEDVRPTK